MTILLLDLILRFDTPHFTYMGHFMEKSLSVGKHLDYNTMFYCITKNWFCHNVSEFGGLLQIQMQLKSTCYNEFKYSNMFKRFFVHETNLNGVSVFDHMYVLYCRSMSRNPTCLQDILDSMFPSSERCVTQISACSRNRPSCLSFKERWSEKVFVLAEDAKG